jgi:hypothetical protein
MLLMRQLLGVGTPRGLQGRLIAVMPTILALIRTRWGLLPAHGRSVRRVSPIERHAIVESAVVHIGT